MRPAPIDFVRLGSVILVLVKIGLFVDMSNKARGLFIIIVAAFRPVGRTIVVVFFVFFVVFFFVFFGYVFVDFPNWLFERLLVS